MWRERRNSKPRLLRDRELYSPKLHSFQFVYAETEQFVSRSEQLGLKGRDRPRL
jgi:hypothetical protein